MLVVKLVLNLFSSDSKKVLNSLKYNLPQAAGTLQEITFDLSAAIKSIFFSPR